MRPADVDAAAVGRAIRELIRLGHMDAERDSPALGWVPVDYLPLLGQHLGFRRKVVSALRRELDEVHARRDEAHREADWIAGYDKSGWVPLHAAAEILRGQGHSAKAAR